MTLTAGELTQMRTVLGTTLPSSAIVQRVTLASDGQGGGEPTWSNAGTVDCRLSPLPEAAGSDREVDQAARVAALRARIVTLPANTDVTQADRLSIGGTIFQITGVRAPRDYELSRRVECVEVD